MSTLSSKADGPGAAAIPAAPASWSAVAAIGVGAFALVSSEFLPVGLLPQIGAEIGISAGQTGLMVSTPGIVAAVAAPLALAFAGKLDRRRVLCFLMALLALSNLTVALAAGFPAMLGGRVLLGIAIGGFWTIGGSLGPRLRPGPQAGRATALIFSGISVGTIAGVPAGTLIGAELGWRMAFGAASAVALLVLAALSLLLPAIKAGAARGLRDVPAVLRLRKIRLGVAANVLIFVGHFAAYTYITPILQRNGGLPASVIGAILFAYGAAGLFGNLVGGWALGRSVRLTLVGAAALLGVAMLTLLFHGEQAALALPLVLAWGFGFGMLPLAIQSWMFSVAPGRLESVAAVFVCSAQAAVGCGALLGGLLVDHFGLASALGTGAACALATALLIAAAGRDA
ncbi:MFS transporter [Janthinobacterium sp.]|uniref:MFS transporter n=1 Tax=Janthinobacterium sp. TaxID=1871054 RepID=UPI00293D4616|nr:MFS transporter [Janthinobacterium sp.]